jgi:MSHA biogenesis protein MshN
LRLNPDFIPLIELKARQLTTQGQIKKALTLLQSQSPPITTNPEYHAFMAALYQKNDNNLLAVSLYKRLLALNPQNGNWWFGLGLSLEKLGEKPLAYDAYRKAISNGNVNQESLAYLQKHMQSLQENVNDEV